jgi:hypothetical protein
MMTINLEKQLIRQNKQLLVPKELLLINEYDKHTELVFNDALSRVGLNSNIKKGQQLKEQISLKKEQTLTFNQERVFHISQIKGICNRFRLRFLPTKYYKGIIDSELPNRITNFEVAYSTKCTSHNTMIVAPVESFELQKKPKDPLMFYRINDEYYYLIHKWGNDLSLKRALLPLFENSIFCWLIIPAMCLLFCFINLNLGYVISGILFSIMSVIAGVNQMLEGNFSFITKNEWDSEYL